MNRKRWQLVLCQGVLLTNNKGFMAISCLVGLQLVSAGWIATLPAMAYSQGRWERKLEFESGLL